MRQQQLLFENKVSKSTPNLLRRAKKSDIMFARTGNKSQKSSHEPSTRSSKRRESEDLKTLRIVVAKYQLQLRMLEKETSEHRIEAKEVNERTKQLLKTYSEEIRKEDHKALQNNVNKYNLAQWLEMISNSAQKNTNLYTLIGTTLKSFSKTMRNISTGKFKKRNDDSDDNDDDYGEPVDSDIVNDSVTKVEATTSNMLRLSKHIMSVAKMCIEERSFMIPKEELEEQMNKLRTTLNAQVKTMQKKHEHEMREILEINHNKNKVTEDETNKYKKLAQERFNTVEIMSQEVTKLKSVIVIEEKMKIDLQNELHSKTEIIKEIINENKDTISDMTNKENELKNAINILNEKIIVLKNGAANSLELMKDKDLEEQKKLHQKINDLEMMLKNEKMKVTNLEKNVSHSNELNNENTEKDKLIIERMRRDYNDIERQLKDSKDKMNTIENENNKQVQLLKATIQKNKINSDNAFKKLKQANAALKAEANVQPIFGIKDAANVARGIVSLILYGATNQTKLVSMFQEFDNDGNNSIDKSEWMDGFIKLRNKGVFDTEKKNDNETMIEHFVSDIVLDMAFKVADVNNSGELDYEEFMHLFRWSSGIANEIEDKLEEKENKRRNVLIKEMKEMEEISKKLEEDRLALLNEKNNTIRTLKKEVDTLNIDKANLMNNVEMHKLRALQMEEERNELQLLLSSTNVKEEEKEVAEENNRNENVNTNVSTSIFVNKFQIKGTQTDPMNDIPTTTTTSSRSSTSNDAATTILKEDLNEKLSLLKREYSTIEQINSNLKFKLKIQQSEHASIESKLNKKLKIENDRWETMYSNQQNTMNLLKKQVSLLENQRPQTSVPAVIKQPTVTIITKPPPPQRIESNWENTSSPYATGRDILALGSILSKMTKDIDALSMSSVINAARLVGALDTSAEATSLRNYRQSVMALNVNMVKCGQWVQEKYIETMKRDRVSSVRHHGLDDSSGSSKSRYKSKSFNTLKSLQQLYDRSGITQPSMLPPTSGTPFQTAPPEPLQFNKIKKMEEQPHMSNVLRRTSHQRPSSAKTISLKKRNQSMLAQQQRSSNRYHQKDRQHLNKVKINLTTTSNIITNTDTTTSTTRMSQSRTYKRATSAGRARSSLSLLNCGYKNISPQKRLARPSSAYSHQHPRVGHPRVGHPVVSVTTLRLSKDIGGHILPWKRSRSVIPPTIAARSNNVINDNEKILKQQANAGTHLNTIHKNILNYGSSNINIRSNMALDGDSSIDSNGIHDTSILDSYMKPTTNYEGNIQNTSYSKIKVAPVVADFGHDTFAELDAENGVNAWNRCKLNISNINYR